MQRTTLVLGICYDKILALSHRGMARHAHLFLCAEKRVEEEPVRPRRAQFRVQPLEVAEEDVVLEEDEVLVVRVFGEDGLE